MKFEKLLDGGIVLENKIKIWWSYDNRYINLKKVRWKDFNPARIEKIVDYPWEFHFKFSEDDEWIYITVYEWENKTLNFIIEGLKDKIVAFIQDKNLLDKEWFENVEVWFFEDWSIEDTLDKLEYEGEKILIQ